MPSYQKASEILTEMNEVPAELLPAVFMVAGESEWGIGNIEKAIVTRDVFAFLNHVESEIDPDADPIATPPDARYWRDVRRVSALLEPNGTYYHKQHREFYRSPKRIASELNALGLGWVTWGMVLEAQRGLVE